MKYVNFFRNKFLDDMTTSKASAIGLHGSQLQRTLGYIKNGDVSKNGQYASSFVDEQEQQTPNNNENHQQWPATQRLARLSAGGARAGYLLGCAMTAPTDLIFGTPYVDTSIEAARKRCPVDQAPRVAFGIVRPRPVFVPVQFSHGIVARLWAPVSGIGQWIGGNIGAVIAAAGFSLAHAAINVTAFLQAKYLPDTVRAQRPGHNEPFAAALKRAAQKGDVVGGILLVAPIHLAMNLTLGVAVWASAGVKGVCSGVGAVVGASVACGCSLVEVVKNPRESGDSLWTAGSMKTSRWVEATIDQFDNQAGLHRAMLASAKRSVDPDEIEQVLRVHHTEYNEVEILSM